MAREALLCRRSRLLKGFILAFEHFLVKKRTESTSQIADFSKSRWYKAGSQQ
jgi:hypothetical protein